MSEAEETTTPVVAKAFEDMSKAQDMLNQPKELV